nr:hypothetical protein FVER53263_00029 [Fusarium verticillioides]
MPYNLDCPEYAGMTAEEKAAAYPSAACFANDTSYLTSMAYCIHTYCPKNVKIYRLEYFWEVKMIYDSEDLTIRWPYLEALAQVNTTSAPKPLSPEETVFNRTISIDSTTYQSYMNGVKGYKEVAKNESMYSILAFMTCVMVPIGFSLLRFLPLPTSFRSKVYGYLIDPPAWGRQHSVATLGIGMVPTRGQALFILYLIGINCLATFAGYPNYAPNGIFPDRHYELMRHIGNRAGSVAFANIPVVILYAGRSSVLLRLTNWSYSTFLLLHRWTATICVVQVALHSLLWLRIMIEGDSYPLVLTYPYWYVGVVGTVAFSALIPFSMLPIRKIMYEVFLITHIVLTIGALVGSWYHIIFLYEDKGGFEIWLIIAFCFWGLERVLRILRISRYGIKKAYVTRIDDKYLRVDIPDVDAQGHCFAYFPTLSWRVWENHPFSIVNCSKGQLDGESVIPSSASHTQSENEGTISPAEASASKEMGGAMSNIRQLRVHSNTTKPGITLFVQNCRGMTAKLAKKADTGIAIPVLIESSYGHEDTTRFDPSIEYPNTLVISGGVGIAGVLSCLQASLSMYAKPLGTTKLYWGIKSKGLVDVVKSMIVGGDAGEEKEGGESSNWGHIETHVSVGERMDIKRVLTKELENAIGGTTVVLGDITEEHAHKDIDDAIAMGLDGFVLNVGYPKLDWVPETLSHLYGYADDLISKGGSFKLALSLDLYATGAWCYDKKLGNDCGGPKEYETVLKGFLGRDSYLRYGPNNFPFITSFSTGNQTDKDFIEWKKSFANEMFFVPGIDDTPGFWESHPAWWQYWGDIIDGASVWESAWPQVHGTNEGDISKDIKVMGPLQKKSKVFMMPISMLQYKNANDGPESHHFGNLWPEQNTDAQPNQYASPDGSDHTALQSLYSAFIHAWKNGGSMVPAFSKRDEAIPQGAFWHKSIFQTTTCPGGDSSVKYFQEPNGTDAGQDALHWALVVPAQAAGFTVNVMSNGKSISSKVLQAGLNYDTVEDGIEEGTQRLVIKNGDTIVGGTDRGRCLARECHDGIYNFNPVIMPVKAVFDNSDCWQVEGEPILDWTGEKVMGTTLGPRDADPSHNHDSAHNSIPFDTFKGCSKSQKEDIVQAWRDIVVILAKIPAFKPGGLLEQRNFGADIAERTSDVSFINGVFANLRKLTTTARAGRTIRASCEDISQRGFAVQSRCSSIKGAAGTIGGYAFDDADGSPGGTIVFCGGFFAPGQEHLAAVQRELDADRTKQKDSIFMTGKFRLMIHELVHLPSVSNNIIGSGKESDVVIKDQYIGADQQTNSNRVYMPEMVEKLARMRTRRYLTPFNADTYAWYTVESFFTAIYGQPPNGGLTGRDDEDPTTTSSAAPEPQPTEQPTTYDCKGSGICSLSTFQVKYCDHAINSLIRNDDKNYGDGKALSGNCWGDSTGNGCGVFVTGKGCVMSGNEMWWKYQDLRDDNKGGCSKCGSVHYGDGCRFTVNY